MSIVPIGEFHLAVEEFREAHPEWSTQEGAFLECDTASVAFGRFMENKPVGQKVAMYWFTLDESDGRRNPDPLMYEPGRNERGDIRSNGHCIVEVDDCFIDWTARQYVAAAPYPHIILKKKSDAATA